MNLIVKQICENIVSVTPKSYEASVNQPTWFDSFKPIANKIFSPLSTMIVVTKWHLRDILSDEAKDFRNNLEDSKKNEYLRETHHFMTHELTHNGIKYIITSLYNVPKNVIDDLITSNEFICGNMYLIFESSELRQFSDDLIVDIKEVLDNSTFLKLPKIKCSLLASSDDGCQVLWFNPTFNVE